MSMHDELRPEEFAEAASAAITEANELSFNHAARTMGEAGLFGISVPEEDGGLALPIAFAVPICQVAGKLRLRFPIVDQILVAKALSGTNEASELASGARTISIAWRRQADKNLADHAAFANSCDWILIPTDDGAVVVDISSVKLKPNASLDPESPQYTVYTEGAPVVTRIPSDRFKALQEEAYLLSGAYLNGAAQGVLEYTTDYLSNRVQFGRPLTAKQAVRHHLARMRLLNEASISAIGRALETNEFSEFRSYRTACSGAIHNALFIIEKAIHLNGGMGFTWEVPLHYALRDARRIEAALDGPAMVSAIAQDFINAA